MLFLSTQAMGDIKPTQKLKEIAINLGAQEEDALHFTDFKQLLALKYGADAKDALKFSSFLQVDALQAGASVDEALQFKNYFQLRALQAGVIPSQALRFTNYLQVEVLKVLINLDCGDNASLEDNIEQALKFSSRSQMNTFMAGQSAKDFKANKPDKEKSAQVN